MRPDPYLVIKGPDDQSATHDFYENPTADLKEDCLKIVIKNLTLGQYNQSQSVNEWDKTLYTP